MTAVATLPYMRREIARRNMLGVSSAQILWGDYDYAKKFPVPKRGARGSGISFERKVLARLERDYPGTLSSVPIRSYLGGVKKMCILDGMVVLPDRVVVVECKLTHCAEAWHQLRMQYFPVVQKALDLPVCLLEVCKNYVPEVVFPEPVNVCVSFEQFLVSNVEFGVWLWGR